MISRSRKPALRLKKRRGLAFVIVAIMMLVGSTVLAGAVVIYGASLFQGGAQQEAISVTGIKMWVHGTDANGLSWGAFGVRNTGDKVLSVDRVVVRGTDVPFDQWYPDTTVSTSIIQQSMNFTGWSNNNGFLNNDTAAACSPNTKMQLVIQTNANPPADGWLCANPGAGPIGLDPGQAAIIYFRVNNGTISSMDGGAQTSVSVFAGKTGAPQSISIGSKT